MGKKDALIDDIFYLMHAVDKVVRREFKGKTRFDVSTHIQLHALSYIKECGPVSMRDLASYMCITAASATSLVDRLVKHKLVLRTFSKNDRRSVYVSITRKGAAVWQKHVVDMRTHMGKLLGRLSVRNQKNLISVLKELHNTFSK